MPLHILSCSDWKYKMDSPQSKQFQIGYLSTFIGMSHHDTVGPVHASDR